MESKEVKSSGEHIAAQALETVLVSKVDKEDGKSLMTDAERAKLSGIEAGANAYALPKASAETLGGIKAGNNLTMPYPSLSGEIYTLSAEITFVINGGLMGNN